MTSEENNYYFLQPWTKEYEMEIPDRRRGDERQLDSLISDVFRHQYAVYRETDPQEPNTTTLSRWFYNNAYVSPKITQGHTQGTPVSLADYLQSVVLRKSDPTRNTISYLLGDVGVGKTAFINWLITCKLKPAVQDRLIWFVRVDVEDIKQGKLINSKELVYFLLERVISIAVDEPKIFKDFDSELDECRLALGSVEDLRDDRHKERIRTLVELARQIQENDGRRLVIIIDNLDYLCHLNDRGLFHDLDDTGEMHVLHQVADCIRMFSHQQELGELGANLLIVTRSDSYRVLNVLSTSYMASSLVRDNARYTLTSPGWKTVLDARCKLLRHAANFYELSEGRQSKLEELPRAIENDLGRGRPRLIDHLVGISNQGLRQLMDFFSNYGWISKESDDMEPRVLEHPSVGLLAFMLHNKCRFGQLPCRFPNIYLVNRIAERPFPTDEEHRHSYWLKRLILAVIGEGKFNDVKDIVNLFRGSSGGGYDESIIKLCLGSLTDALSSNCVSVERGLNPTPQKDTLVVLETRLNLRGEHCLKNIFDRFSYLQLVVEDYLLPLPRCVEDFFPKSRFERLNYSYLVESANNYRSALIDMVRVKVEQVFLFLEILERSQRMEREFFSDVFDRLERRAVKIPDTREIRRNVLDELRTLNPYLSNRVDLAAAARTATNMGEIIGNQLRLAYEAGAR